MTLIEVKEETRKIISDILDKRIGEGIKSLSPIIIETHNSQLISKLESIRDTYSTMLKYSFSSGDDPQREKIYTHIQKSLVELTDKVFGFYSLKLELSPSYLKGLTGADIEKVKAEPHNETICHLEQFYPDKLKKEELKLQQSRSLEKVLFRLFLLSEELNEIETELIQASMDSELVSWQQKSILISALSLSNFRHFDSKKMALLFSLIQHNEEQVKQRALIGFIFSIWIYQNRLHLYPDLLARIKSLPDFESFQDDLLRILVQFIKAQETEEITRKIREEIMPEVMKMRSEIEDKINLDEILSQSTLEEKNPEWENIFKDSPDVYQKLEQFSQMQVDGSDVFMGAFAYLKNFDFFRELGNWFIPFDQHNPVVSTAMETMDDSFDSEEFADALEQSSLLCNSDKYSFILNVGLMPLEQRQTMLELFKMELSAMNEMVEDDKKLDEGNKKRTITTQYIQDLYRFYKVFPQRGEFFDIFSLNLNVSESIFFKEIFETDKPILKLAEYYFGKDKFSEAIDLFIQVFEKEQTFELSEKIGYCYQKLGLYQEAIEYYNKGELFNAERPWLMKKLGFCHRKCGNFDQAIEYFKKLEIADPEDLETQAYLGQLSIDKKDYETAIKYYFKVEYLKPDNVKVQRPLAWCNLLLGKTDSAIKYFVKVVGASSDKGDYLNLGHAYWCNQDKTSAIDSYKKAYAASGNDKAWFDQLMRKDLKYLEPFGIEETDVCLLSDYLTFLDSE